MIVLTKETQEKNNVEQSQIPLILALNSYGDPVNWINYEKCAYYQSKDKILWSLGTHEVILRGGINAKTGRRSTLSLDTIVAIKYEKSHVRKHDYSPLLNNKSLFLRDKNMCAYCGQIYPISKLTRDHIVPTSKGGTDCWSNVVCSCYNCNQWKGNRLLQDLNMELLYVPYVPSFHEYLILKNRNILANQMEFLIKGVSKDSRLFN